MDAIRLIASSLLLPFFLTIVAAQAPAPLPVLDDKPSPQVDAGGPSAAVTALAFSPDGETLYAAGLDKVVRVWTLQRGRFVLKTTHRVPVGPGNAGGLNAVALSPDGAWLAMAGRAPMRGEVGFRQGGVIVEAAALSSEQNQDAGVIYVASTANPAAGKVLRGHRGEVRALAFAPPSKGKPPLLVSAATERDGARRFSGLRLWDAAAGKFLAARDGLSAKVIRPGLAVWHTGPAATQIRCAVEWPEEDDAKKGSFHLWDPSPGAVALQGWEDDRFNQTAALVGEEDGVRVLTGGLGPDSGRLRVWRLSADRETAASIGAEVAVPPSGKIHFLPVSLAVLTLPGHDAPTHAAVILQPAADSDFRLALVDLGTNSIVADVSLTGSNKTQLPALAARGRHVVVAATRDHAVRVFTVAGLLEGKAEPVDVLAGAGLAPRQVAFVKKEHSLWLTEDGQARPLSGGLIVDLDKRKIATNDGGDLAADAPDLGEWSFTIDRDRKGVHVLNGQKELPPLRLRGKDEVVTAAALRPPAPGRPGVLAAAYTEREANRTLILLCDPADGKPYRLLVSHLHDVRQLAFSASRPLLASVADDQTICVWSLADVQSAVGEVSGLGVADEGKTVVVRRVEANSPAAKTELAEGDALAKVGAPGGVAKPIKDAADFLLTVSARRPGDQLEVTVAGKGVVKLPVERGVDERKPLFSLFLLHTPGLPEWVGWSPAGPYDASGPAAEARLGWHTNTGDPASPVAYTAAGEYRKVYYREGILRYLAAEADLGRALQKYDVDHPPRPPRPALRPLRPEGAFLTERADVYLTRAAVKTLRVGINDDYPLDDVHVLGWRLTRADGGKVKADGETSGLASRDGKAWEINLAGVVWQRGEYILRAGLRKRNDAPELAAETVTLRFQPPAPVVALHLDGEEKHSTEQKPLSVMEEKLDLQIALTAPAGQEVGVGFAHSRNGLAEKDAPPTRVVIGSRKFTQEFKLREGLNRLAVKAVNKGALAPHEDEETAFAALWVSYKAPREPPPRFTTLRLEPEPEVVRESGVETWVVSRPDVRLMGKIEAEGVLVQADWSAGGEPASALPPREARTAEFTAKLELKAGDRAPVRLHAKSKHSDVSTTERWVVYYPPLPTVAVDPLNGEDVLAEKLTLTGTFESATKDPFQLHFRVAAADGSSKKFPAEVDLKADKWKVELSLYPGGNSIEPVVANKWRGEKSLPGMVKLRYRRPPRITAFPETVEAVETNKVRLPLTVEGPADRPLTGVKVDQNLLPFQADKPETEGDRSTWKIVLPEVFVNDGERNLEKVSVQAVTDEGESRAVVVAVVHKKIPRPPSARFVSPASADTAGRPEYPATFRVESRKPLERVEIRRGDKVLYEADLKKVEREGELHVLQGEAVLKLRNGPNALEVVAVNADGRSLREPRSEVVVGYTEPAVQVIIDRGELMADNGDVKQVLTPVYRSSGDLSFPTAPASLVWLVGRVRWSDPKAKALTDPSLEVVVRVGDCRQFPAALGSRGEGGDANVRPFRVPLVLIGKENTIKVEVPSVGQQELSRREFKLPCSAPVEKQRLHVLVVGVNVKDAAGLKKRVLDALAVEAGDRPPGVQGEFLKKPPFDRCVLYHLLIDEVDRSMVEAQLVEINSEIKRLKRETGWLNDVVLIYYQGEDVETPDKKERWLKTSANFRFPSTPPQEFAIPCHDLPRVPGAQLLLLNVAGPRNPRAVGADWGGDPQTGFMRYACRDRTEAAKPDPALLGLLEEAMRKNGQLGEVFKYLENLLGKQQGAIPPFTHLDKDLASRRFNVPEP
jgi:WD40 repeat protein